MKKSSIYGLIGSVLSCTLLFLMLWLIVMPVLAYKTPEEEEGLIVSFGDSDDGGGMTQNPAGDVATASQTTVATTQPKVVEQHAAVLTQSDNSESIAEQKQKDQNRREQLEVENQRIESNKRAAEQKYSEQAAIERAGVMNGKFGNSKSGGSGTGTGDTRQGNPAGKGSSGGNSWSLNGRSLTGHLSSPSYDKDVEGKVTVNIKVDKSGNVISTSIGTPTTISDASTRRAAESAAKNAHFSQGSDESYGSITYSFNLR